MGSRCGTAGRAKRFSASCRDPSGSTEGASESLLAVLIASIWCLAQSLKLGFDVDFDSASSSPTPSSPLASDEPESLLPKDLWSESRSDPSDEQSLWSSFSSEETPGPTSASEGCKNFPTLSAWKQIDEYASNISKQTYRHSMSFFLLWPLWHDSWDNNRSVRVTFETCTKLVPRFKSRRRMFLSR